MGKGGKSVKNVLNALPFLYSPTKQQTFLQLKAIVNFISFMAESTCCLFKCRRNDPEEQCVSKLGQKMG